MSGFFVVRVVIVRVVFVRGGFCPYTLDNIGLYRIASFCVLGLETPLRSHDR